MFSPLTPTSLQTAGTGSTAESGESSRRYTGVEHSPPGRRAPEWPRTPPRSFRRNRPACRGSVRGCTPGRELLSNRSPAPNRARHDHVCTYLSVTSLWRRRCFGVLRSRCRHLRCAATLEREEFCAHGSSVASVATPRERAWPPVLQRRPSVRPDCRFYCGDRDIPLQP